MVLVDTYNNAGYGNSLALFYKKYKGKNIICGGYSDKTIKIWVIGEKKPICVLDGHQDWINSLADISDNELILKIASGSYDKTVRKWEIELDFDNHQVIKSSSEEIAFSNSIYYMLRTSFIPDRQLLAICTYQEVFFIDLKDNIIQSSGKIHSNFIYCIVNLSKYKELSYATCSYDHLIHINQFCDKKFTNTLKGHTDAVWFMIYMEEHDKDILVSGSWDKKVIIWSLGKSLALYVISDKHTSSIRAITKINLPLFSQKYFFSGGTDGKTVLCHVNGKVINEYNLHGDKAIYFYDVYMKDESFYLISSGLDKNINIFEIMTN